MRPLLAVTWRPGPSGVPLAEADMSLASISSTATAARFLPIAVEVLWRKPRGRPRSSAGFA
ncbi:MAG: hypothetical protein LBG06_00360 [Deltaproteobacteria bacterium]|nr:hypothetical protein [Deltaproteobacteria bacterium]